MKSFAKLGAKIQPGPTWNTLLPLLKTLTPSALQYLTKVCLHDSCWQPSPWWKINGREPKGHVPSELQKRNRFPRKETTSYSYGDLGVLQPPPVTFHTQTRVWVLPTPPAHGMVGRVVSQGAQTAAPPPSRRLEKERRITFRSLQGDQLRGKSTVYYFIFYTADLKCELRFDATGIISGRSWKLMRGLAASSGGATSTVEIRSESDLCLHRSHPQPRFSRQATHNLSCQPWIYSNGAVKGLTSCRHSQGRTIFCFCRSFMQDSFWLACRLAADGQDSLSTCLCT